MNSKPVMTLKSISGEMTLKRILQWLQFRRVCSWCHGYMGGNPFTSHVTHGVCKKCSGKFLEGI